MIKKAVPTTLGSQNKPGQKKRIRRDKRNISMDEDLWCMKDNTNDIEWEVIKPAYVSATSQ